MALYLHQPIYVRAGYAEQLIGENTDGGVIDMPIVLNSINPNGTGLFDAPACTRQTVTYQTYIQIGLVLTQPAHFPPLPRQPA